MATDKTQAALDSLNAGIDALVDGDDWKRALDFAARFHNYSFGNQMLIAFGAAAQGFTATRVAGFNRWKDLGRTVRKGSKGLAILAPNTYRKEIETDNGETETRVGIRGFRVAYVFDVSQTEGEPLPDDCMPMLLDGDGDAVSALWARGAAHVSAIGYTLERGDCDGANGWTNFLTRTVRVRDDVSDLQATKTLMHEIAHATMHAPDAGFAPRPCRGIVEVEAESVAYVVLHALGFDSSGYTFPYVAQWAKGDRSAIKATGDAVAKAAKGILAALQSDDVPALVPA